MEKEKNSHKNIVQEIFTRQGSGTEKVSTIFTYFKHQPKILLSSDKSQIPSSLKPLPAAIDITSNFVKLIRLAQGQKGELEIIAVDEEKYSAASLPDVLILQQEALKKIIQRNNIGHECVIAVGASDIQTYNITFPYMPDGELKAALQYKLAQMKPFGLDIKDINFGFLKWDATLQLKKTAEGIRLFVVSVPFKTINQKIQLLQAVNLTPVSIEVSPVSLVNLGKFSKRPPTAEEVNPVREQSFSNGVNIWLDLGVEQSLLVIEKGGKTLFLRPLTFASSRLAKAISRYLGISDEDARQMQKQYGVSHWPNEEKSSAVLEGMMADGKPGDKAVQVYRAIISHLENMLVDIEHSFKYFSYQVSQYQVTKFDRVILTGDAVDIKDMDSFLNAKLGVPVEIINPFNLFGISQISHRQAVFGGTGNAAGFAVCAGLALSLKTEETHRINLLAAAEGKNFYKTFRKALKDKTTRIIIAVTCLIVLVTGFEVVKWVSARRQAASVESEINKTKTQLDYRNLEQLELAKEETEILNKKALLESRLNLLKESMRKPDDFSNILWATGLLLPAEVWVTKLTYKEGQLNITGSTQDINLIMQLVETLKAKEEFSGADFLYTQIDPASGIYNFEVNVEIKK